MGTTPPITTNNPQNTRSTKPDQTKGPLFGLFLFVALAVFDARAVVVVAEDQIASRLGDTFLVETSEIDDALPYPD